MLECPNCNANAMTKMEKFMLGPARTKKCKNCGAKVSVSWISMLYFSAFFLPMIFINMNATFIKSIIVLIICSTCFGFLQFYRVPIVSK